MSNNYVGIVLAGGYGTLCNGRSKLIEPVNGIPMVCHPVHLLRHELGLTTLVVVNTMYGEQIRSALSGHPQEQFVHIERRCGTAGAVAACFPVLRELDAQNVVVLYGDMPCFRIASIMKLVTEHQHQAAVISMFRIDLEKPHGCLVESFGRILYDDKGKIIAVREPEEMTVEELARTRYVNPSAWVFQRSWIEENISALTPHNKGDGFSDELWLPDFVTLAFGQGKKTAQIDLEDPREACGINNERELEQVHEFNLTKETASDYA